jgi:hypothetical protein
MVVVQQFRKPGENAIIAAQETTNCRKTHFDAEKRKPIQLRENRKSLK